MCLLLAYFPKAGRRVQLFLELGMDDPMEMVSQLYIDSHSGIPSSVSVLCADSELAQVVRKFLWLGFCSSYEAFSP